MLWQSVVVVAAVLDAVELMAPTEPVVVVVVAARVLSPRCRPPCVV
jgi:hypothetical protein